MSSFLFDTNALVYWVYPDSPHNEEVTVLLQGVLSGRGSAYALTSSLNEVYYVLRRQYMSEEDARESIREIAEVFDLVDLTGLFVFDALDSDEPDYEDGLIRAAGEALGVDAIITYDKKAFRSSVVPSLTAREALTNGLDGYEDAIATLFPNDSAADAAEQIGDRFSSE